MRSTRAPLRPCETNSILAASRILMRLASALRVAFTGLFGPVAARLEAGKASTTIAPNISFGTQLCRGARVQHSPRVECHAVMPSRVAGRDFAVEQVLTHFIRLAQHRIAKPSGAGLLVNDQRSL